MLGAIAPAGSSLIEIQKRNAGAAMGCVRIVDIRLLSKEDEMSYRRARMLGKLSLGIAVLAASLMTWAAPASAQFSVEWVQLGGNFRVAATRAGSPNSPLCVHGLSCSCPGSRNFCGQHRNGAEVSFWKDGCNRPPLTIQCVIRPTGTGPQGAGGGFASGRYEMKTSAFTAIVNLNVNGNTFSGTADWNSSGATP